MRKVEDKSKEEIVKIGRKIGAAFAEAEKKNIPCVLDTDTPLKVKKYGYEARFTACGICTLMRELELYDLVFALCRLDYTMAEAGGISDFVREYTLASGGPYCDCGYKKKWKGNGRKRK